MRSIIIPSDVTRPIMAVWVAHDDLDEQLVDITRLVGGFERVKVGDWRTREQFGTPEYWVTMVVDDNSQVKGLPENLRASILYGAPIHGHGIYGDALLLGEHYGPEGPEFTTLPPGFDDAHRWRDWFIQAALDLTT